MLRILFWGTMPSHSYLLLTSYYFDKHFIINVKSILGCSPLWVHHKIHGKNIFLQFLKSKMNKYLNITMNLKYYACVLHDILSLNS
jgi:hypothetical protein